MGVTYPNDPKTCDHSGRWMQRPQDSADGKGYIYCPKCGSKWPIWPKKEE